MSFELQPTLRGNLLELRPLREDDWDALYAAASDPLIWELHPSSDRYKPEVFREYFRGGMESGGAFVVIDRSDGKIIGSSRYNGYDAERSEIEIGWTFLARSHWGGRFNGEMKQLMVQHALLFVDRVVFHIGPQNWRSQKAIEKLGGIPAGTWTDPKTGHESVVYEMRTAPEGVFA
ncbi:MAG TPA: GNAT family N-acetyltransferase [Terracidiphilus sp.]|nr:GNAT family N-acetyltransferase [Terracidiphilus sp.]